MKPTNPKAVRARRDATAGFTLLELLIVVAVVVVAAALVIPGYASMNRFLRISGDGRNLNGTIAEAKMRAAQAFTHARLRANLSNNTFQLEVWNKAANGGAGCWQTEGDTLNQCTVANSPTQPLSTGVQFGFGGVGAAAPNPQAVVAQAPLCLKGVAGGTALGAYANTACIEFSSRGLPVAADGSPTANDAMYVTDTNTVYGVTVIISGLIQTWSTPASNTAWEAR